MASNMGKELNRDDVVIESELSILGTAEDDIAEHLDALEAAIQALRTVGAGLLVPADHGAQLLLRSE
eukprot:m.493160 g.493160  ORF g.493160 m.493160 type:complete len:67 (-) comp57280_c0_seq28:1423-1623(-)